MAYGFRRSVKNLNKVMFPGDRRNCEMPARECPSRRLFRRGVADGGPEGLHQSDASGDCALPCHSFQEAAFACFGEYLDVRRVL